MRKLIFLAGMILSIVSYGFQMIPSSFDQRIDEDGGYMEYRFPNNTSKIVRYKFTAVKNKDKSNDMSEWVEVYPKILTIRPEEIGLLKLFVMAPKGTKEGEYNFILDITPIEVIPKDKKVGEAVKGKTAIKMKFQIGLRGYAGNLKPEIEILEKKFYKKDNKDFLDVKVKNLTSKRSLSLESRITNENRVSYSEFMGRLEIGGTSVTTIPLDKFKGIRPDEIEFVEAILKTPVAKDEL